MSKITNINKLSIILIQQGLFGIIEFKHEHSHQLNTAETLSLLKPAAEVKEAFHNYFKSGLGEEN
jgi:hypothetical protein